MLRGGEPSDRINSRGIFLRPDAGWTCDCEGRQGRADVTFSQPFNEGFKLPQQLVGIGLRLDAGCTCNCEGSQAVKHTEDNMGPRLCKIGWLQPEDGPVIVQAGKQDERGLQPECRLSTAAGPATQQQQRQEIPMLVGKCSRPC
jgi:hypothetical protein